MTRVALRIAYDGSDFSGWQVQPGRRTVQGVLEQAAAALDPSGPAPAVRGAGRTDAGVHAAGQVASVDLPDGLDLDRIPAALNARLPSDVSVLEAAALPERLDVRHDAASRRYVYLIWNAASRNPLLARWATWIREPLDVSRLDRALETVVGTHDFSSFARVREEQDPVRTVTAAHATADRGLISVVVEGRSFLHQMVRSIVGTAIPVAAGRRPVSSMARALLQRDRAAAGPVAAPEGLCLADVRHEELIWKLHTPWPWGAGAPTSPRAEAVGR